MNLLQLNQLQTREALHTLEDYMLANGASDAEEMEAQCIKRYFAPGVYVREMYLPKNTLVVGKCHRKAGICILTKGMMLLKNENSLESIVVEAPYTFVAEPGKKVGYALENSIFINVHPNPTNSEDIEFLESQIIEPDRQALEVVK